jgi:hypothetical protein
MTLTALCGWLLDEEHERLGEYAVVRHCVCSVRVCM